MAKKKTCFVVMGFGKKVDYDGDRPRTLDLDASYEAIIKPAVSACGLECVRADEIMHSGIIDKAMYEMLLRADVVIADISTANPNALYELGVRHALRPSTTVVMKEQDGKFLFDLNHVNTLQYKHLGDDIGAKEAKAKTAALTALIQKLLENPKDDSPVYTFLQGLKGPMLTGEQLETMVATVKAESDSLSQALDIARRAAAESQSAVARDHFQQAYDIQLSARRASAGIDSLPDPYIIQQLALHTYKAKPGNAAEPAALNAAERIIEQLKPSLSTDPETLGIAGAIQKRLYQATREGAHLDAAIEFYGRGFEVKRDYYNGENYALCLEWRADVASTPGDATYDRMTAHKVRQRIVDSLTLELADPQLGERPDHHWMLASMANALYALGRDGSVQEAQFRARKPAQREIETFEEGKHAALALAQRL